ncbi:hypothetical protein FS749_004937 [Ceratobasidium sp. UAMH 11750]|nr:hypothetical protein FS749_004937 [Ceratobasidium sp. UAMH 11750]
MAPWHITRWRVPLSHPLPSSTSTMSLDDDFETLLELTARLQLQDIEEWRASQKGKGRPGFLSDAEMSFNAMEAEHKATLQSIADRRIARSAQRAMAQDRDLIDAIAAIEEQERADRRFAFTLSGNPNAQVPPLSSYGGISRPTYSRAETPSSSSVASYPGSVTSRLEQMSLGSSRTSVNSNIKPVSTASFVPSILRLAGGRPTADCIICSDTVTQAYQAPCGCFYDRDCLTELFQKATVDESLFPPRCCNRQISFQEVRTIFTPELVRAFEQKAQEFKTPNRLYCHSPTCSTFLGPAVGNEREKSNKQCTRCYRHTCNFCKGAGHASHVPCTTDTAAQQVLALGRQEGWQSCPSCHHMVELSVGCYHMTCRCRHEFCYLCAQQWKNCTCPQWDEERLVEHAERRVVRDQGALPRAPGQALLAARALQIRRAADALRENHECAHHLVGFVKQNGSGNCESCGNWLRDFLLVSVIPFLF